MRRCTRFLASLLALASPAPALSETRPAHAAEPVALPAEQPPAGGAGEQAVDPDDTWCVPELEQLPSRACVHLPPATPPGAQGTLVIFLHGVVKPASGWQHAQQRAALRQARAGGVSLLLPRGRRGHGNREATRDYWTWPTSAAAQRTLEAEILEEWAADRAALEARRGAPFARVLVMGFSNGAYYATSLALRGRLAVDGYAVFAGGAGGEWMERSLRGAQRRVPIYVGWGARDRAASDPAELAQLLEKARWPHRAKRRPGVGHAFTDAMFREALEYLSAARAGQVESRAPVPKRPEPPTGGPSARAGKRAPDAKPNSGHRVARQRPPR